MVGYDLVPSFFPFLLVLICFVSLFPFTKSCTVFKKAIRDDKTNRWDCVALHLPVPVLGLDEVGEGLGLFRGRCMAVAVVVPVTVVI